MTPFELMTKLIEQYDQKNLAYGNSAHQTFCRYGKASYALRLSDKFQRLETLIASPGISCADESINDTLGDAITYTFMYAADLICEKYPSMKLEEKDSGVEPNVSRTRKMMALMGCNSQEEIFEMADAFQRIRVDGTESLTDVIYNMYLDENSLATEYVMLAAYLIKIYMERNTTDDV